MYNQETIAEFIEILNNAFRYLGIHFNRIDTDEMIGYDVIIQGSDFHYDTGCVRSYYTVESDKSRLAGAIEYAVSVIESQSEQKMSDYIGKQIYENYRRNKRNGQF